MDTRIIDLHVHSNASDGTCTPTQLVAEAKKAGLSAFALTDHDTALPKPRQPQRKPAWS